MSHPLPPYAHSALTTTPTAPHFLSMQEKLNCVYFTSKTTMVFLPGDHALDTNITVTNATRLTMCGESSSNKIANVVCSGSVGLSFTSIVEFEICYLTFTSCSRNFVSPLVRKYALLLDSTKYAKLVNCFFHDNLGTVLAVNNSNVTLVGNIKFTCNHCEKCIGGGIMHSSRQQPDIHWECNLS